MHVKKLIVVIEHMIMRFPRKQLIEELYCQ